MRTLCCQTTTFTWVLAPFWAVAGALPREQVCNHSWLMQRWRPQMHFWPEKRAKIAILKPKCLWFYIRCCSLISFLALSQRQKEISNKEEQSFAPPGRVFKIPLWASKVLPYIPVALWARLEDDDLRLQDCRRVKLLVEGQALASSIPYILE